MSKAARSIALRYCGIDPVNEWLPGVPARDLATGEADDLGLDVAVLCASAFYEPQGATVTPPQDAPAATSEEGEA